MVSKPSHPTVSLFLTRAACELVDSQQRLPSWAESAHWLTSLSSEPVTSIASVIHASAVVCAYRDVIAAYQGADPRRIERVLAASGPGESLHGALDQMDAVWGTGCDADVPAGILLDAVASNPALAFAAAATGSEQWRSHPVLQGWAERFRECEASEPVPAGMPGSLMSMLMAPAQHRPDDLAGQLVWISEEWSEWLSESFTELVALAEDVSAEEGAVRMAGPGPAQPGGIESEIGLGTAAAYGEPGAPGFVDASARFSDDTEWMPSMVMMAKQTFVWLDQLSRQYGYTINRLDQIPDAELDTLAARGFRGLWLIGLWERSPASREIKVRRGNPEAASSAYSLNDYVIAQSLGGPDALAALKHRASQRGLRLAADMVPNHMGMDSRWMAEHPERFLQLPFPPYPGYQFTGPNLSGDDRIEVYLEDGYWEERDAAVVFKCVHRDTAEIRYVYHGNDGTQMPWNDTAQLDYLQPAVRESVIQTILEVARQFPIIRFDAAMTLARKHIARLWYPPPGGGGAIPSRAEHTVPPEVLDRMLPGEFWREVVERVRLEVPDTLLLAEAFWMMEGYFVRTLGMHRVYNSAFMHMLRDEDNAGYRGAIKQVLEYSPAILERYVNFMNNPDEDTAVSQFGKGDKYFGIATMMSTLPGLPMYGHGQVEGYSEKYGMEFTRAYVDEEPDQGLIDHHDAVIFPILRERHKFCGVAHFALMDFWRDGQVDENVFAYANRSGHSGEPSLVIYNNAHPSTAGWVRTSTAINIGEQDAPELVHRSLGEALGVANDPEVFYAMWELRRRAWLLRSGAELWSEGLFVDLGGYDALVFLDIRPAQDFGLAIENFVDGYERGWVADLAALKTPSASPESVVSDEPAAAEVDLDEEFCQDVAGEMEPALEGEE